MSVLTEVRTKLVALGTLGTITIGFMPGSPDVIGTIYEYGGRSPERGYGVSGIKYENPSFQLVFRGASFDYAGPRTKAEIAYLYLATLQPGALGATVTTNYLMIEPQQAPHPISPVDANNRHLIGINFYATKEPSA